MDDENHSEKFPLGKKNWTYFLNMLLLVESKSTCFSFVPQISNGKFLFWRQIRKKYDHDLSSV